MSTPSRFQTAVPTSRPRHQRVVEAYSLKLRRRLQCFGDDVFAVWIRLETDPSVLSFCERPTFIGSDASKKLADFWIRRQDSEALLVVADQIDVQSVTINGSQIPVQVISAIELAAARTWTSNWERMLPVAISSRDLLSRALLNSVARFVSEPTQLSRIEREFNSVDIPLVRAAVFTLLHNGRLKAPQLFTEPLSLLTSFEPSGDVQ